MTKRRTISGMGELFAFPLDTSPAEPNRSMQPPDSPERERALDVSRSWIVEAPAGSGKTGLLIQRYLKLLALPSTEQPEQVLAITFTLKATGEIRERVLDQLERARKPETSTDDFARQTRTLAKTVLERDDALGGLLIIRVGSTFAPSTPSVRDRARPSCAIWWKRTVAGRRCILTLPIGRRENTHAAWRRRQST